MTNRYPIIYIRGYAMVESERNETALDPFCGFNFGSTVYRATIDKKEKPEKFIFESPLVRLMTEYQYRHVYQEGTDIIDPAWEKMRDADGNTIEGIPLNSIIILRYYDDGSSIFGDGKSRNILEYAKNLNDLILKVKALTLEYRQPDGSFLQEADFRCYLVAHSMGGLVARALLQNPSPLFAEARNTVDKFFTFATPHNGIDMLGMNVPSWLTKEQINTFSRVKMMDYLHLNEISPAFDHRVDLISQKDFPADKIFCMVGTNRGDYEVLQGIVRAFVGHGSDGLVRVDNASLWGIDALNIPSQAATAYTFRSHSGPYGIVNSEEAYQNLVRFLFGDVRVDIWLDVDDVTLPDDIKDKSNVSALYKFEFTAAPKGKRWFLSRRTAVEDSCACRTHAQLTNGQDRDSKIYLSTVFLSKRGKVDKDPQSKTLSYAMTIAVKTPDYEIERKFWPDGHYEGASLFQGAITVVLTPPDDPQGIGEWQVDYGWLSASAVRRQTSLNYAGSEETREIVLPFTGDGNPNITGRIRLMVRPWH